MSPPLSIPGFDGNIGDEQNIFKEIIFDIMVRGNVLFADWNFLQE